MGKPAASATDEAQTVVTAALVATSDSSISLFLGFINFAAWGAFVGTVIVQNSYDGGTTWIPCKDRLGNLVSLTGPGQFDLEEVEPGMLYKMTCTAYTSGTINCRLSAGTNILAVQGQRLT